MNYELVSVTACVVLFFGLILLVVVGHRLGRQRLLKDPHKTGEGIGPIEGAIFALLGLLIAFSFAGAYSRFDARRQLIVQEVNALGTAYLRLDLLPADAQPVLREKFRIYVSSRLAFWEKLTEVSAAWAEYERNQKLQDEIWKQTVEALSGESYNSARMLLLPALNEMIDITTTRLIAIQTHPPLLVFLMLFVLALASAAVTGNGMAKSESLNWVPVIGFAAIIAFTIYVILDIEYPRYGLIRLDLPHELFVKLQESMK